MVKKILLWVLIGLWGASLSGCSLIGTAIAAGAAYGMTKVFSK